MTIEHCTRLQYFWKTHFVLWQSFQVVSSYPFFCHLMSQSHYLNVNRWQTPIVSSFSRKVRNWWYNKIVWQLPIMQTSKFNGEFYHMLNHNKSVSWIFSSSFLTSLSSWVIVYLYTMTLHRMVWNIKVDDCQEFKWKETIYANTCGEKKEKI